MARHRPSRPIPAAHRAARVGWKAGAAIALVLGIAVAWSVARRPVRPTASAPPAPTDHALAARDLPAANQRAIELVEAHRFVESFPYFRREFELIEQPVWGLHHDFGTVLNNGAFETRQLRGLTVPLTRGTIERVALVREALAQQDRAARLVSQPLDLARVWERRAHVLWLWGFRWDGFAAYRRALAALPASRSIAARLTLRIAQLRDPVHVTAADENALP